MSELAFLSQHLLATIANTALVMSRALGVVLVMPFFVRLGLTGVLRFGVALAFCMPVMPTLNANVAADMASVMVAVLTIKELALGIVIGVVLGVPFWAAEIAGDLIDLQRGSTAAQLVDPSSVTESSITATFFTLATMLVFVSSGGLTMLLESFYKSYAIWPIMAFSPLLAEHSGVMLLATLDRILEVAILLIAPLVLALLVADIMLAFLSRIAPQLHVFDLSMSVKNLLFSLLIVLYSAFLLPMIQAEVLSLSDTTDWLERLTASSGDPR
ncbi:type III secretion system export apparatus subunit SctT [Ensifer sp. ENS02]|uniref:type III secretion system export apparatus subunit SctT n=1 Tax=Ensifer sp. ENS02 TaxID=2769290 RepID=UPI00177A8E39|nr:type III secretion system export apparatus subunit SctT [Ensifer sp. ENS02]MBD9524743.1 type III secretion system export apparatus subunit SctT [Ensifer sp. ENS02]